jgi:hypothetical protein
VLLIYGDAFTVGRKISLSKNEKCQKYFGALQRELVDYFLDRYSSRIASLNKIKED